MAARIFRTAVALVPPETVWEPIQAVRRLHDRQITRWMPHVNLLYPFYPEADWVAALPCLAEACARVAPFALTLARLDFFQHGSGRATLWLAPEPARAVRALQAALQAAAPDCVELSRFPGGFTPHLSVGQFAGPDEVRRAREELQARWQPLSFLVDAVALLGRAPDTPFEVRRRLPLGGSVGATAAQPLLPSKYD
jgi:2'-5' RNA ligase